MHIFLILLKVYILLNTLQQQNISNNWGYMVTAKTFQPCKSVILMDIYINIPSVFKCVHIRQSHTSHTVCPTLCKPSKIKAL